MVNLISRFAFLTQFDEAYPQRRAALIAAYQRYAKQNNIIRPNRSFYDGLEQILPPRPPVDAEGYPRGQEPNYAITK